MSALHKLKAYFGMVPADEFDEYDGPDDYEEAYSDGDYDAERGARWRAGKTRGYSADSDDDRYLDSRSRRQWSGETAQRGGEAPRLRAVTETGTQYSLSKITTLHPRSYSEARTIGEQYRDGIPVIINLTEMDEADAKRLVDFAAGLVFGLRGSIDKVTNRVFLLSPPNVDVTADSKHAGTFFNYG